MRNEVGSRQRAEGNKKRRAASSSPSSVLGGGARGGGRLTLGSASRLNSCLSPVPCPLSPARSGITLIELLIVVVIMTTLVAAAIPLMSPASDARRIREAARGLNTYITSAQSRAINTGRPHGIVLKKLSSDTNSPADNGVCLEVFQCEQPPPFAGFDENAAMRVAPYFPSNATLYGGARPLYLLQFVTRGLVDTSTDGLPAGWDADTIPEGVVRPGDVVELAGNRYQLLADTNDGVIKPKFGDPNNTFFAWDTGKPDANKATQIVARPLDGIGPTLNPTHDDRGNDLRLGTTTYLPYFSYPVPYKILRQPMQTSTEPYQLPAGTAIDLRASGDYEVFFHAPDGVLDANPLANQQIDNRDPVIVMFTPEGSVERVRFNKALNSPQHYNIDSPTTYDLFLLIGLRENVPLSGTDAIFDFNVLSSAGEEALEEQKAKYNWLNLDSRWVMIGPQSGNVVTVENAFVNPVQVAALSGTPFDKRNAEIRRAREFAREMTRTGGR